MKKQQIYFSGELRIHYGIDDDPRIIIGDADLTAVIMQHAGVPPGVQLPGVQVSVIIELIEPDVRPAVRALL